MKTNKLEVKWMKSEHCTEKHLNIVVDGIPLDVLLHQLYPTDYLNGLIPTILEWVDNQEEMEFVKGRYTSTNKEEILPILMCPDDCDLWCTVVVAKVIKEGDYVTWDQIGIDRSVREDLILGYECIGSKVQWLEKVPRMFFNKAEYDCQLNKIYS
ncbi:hypothetical protein J2Z48_002878 [Croceifilum oryzae]|uniref:Uncharacterized protein n=1 Tax=Croceifilum oryzae TaxID=1553429 RepID=A0AAJ1WTC9_9BACL|nr:hypothetical protein [Croceifilum oryzae]MDQ0418675.1 hypothetical protein [Croceifilum oryzae]